MKRGHRSAGRQQSPSGGGLKTTLGIAGLAVFVLATPTFVVAAVGMVPTIVALIVDRSPRKYAWLVMYSAAAIGWLLYLGLPPLVSMFLRIHADQRTSSLRTSQAALVKEWGKGVADRTAGK
jgi:hypothetical protein